MLAIIFRALSYSSGFFQHFNFPKLRLVSAKYSEWSNFELLNQWM